MAAHITDLDRSNEPLNDASPIPNAPRHEASLNDADRMSLCELLDRVLNKGVVVRGEVVITVADIELLYLGLELILCATETARQAGVRLPTDMNAARFLPIPTSIQDPLGKK